MGILDRFSKKKRTTKSRDLEQDTGDYAFMWDSETGRLEGFWLRDPAILDTFPVTMLIYGAGAGPIQLSGEAYQALVTDNYKIIPNKLESRAK